MAVHGYALDQLESKRLVEGVVGIADTLRYPTDNGPLDDGRDRREGDGM